MAEIIPFYKDTFLPSRLESLKTMISADEEAVKDFKHLQFTEGVINGRIAVVEPEEETKKRAKAKKAANRAIRNANATETAMQKAEFKNFVNNISKKSRR
jgi:type III secretory pathway lipoprotein EscJ